MQPRNRTPELITFIVDKLTQLLTEEGFISHDEAVSIANTCTNELCFAMGGLVIYIPTNMSRRVSERDLKLFHEFRGNNHSDLALKYGLSLQRVYKIIKEVQREELAKRQPDLFYGNDDPELEK